MAENETNGMYVYDEEQNIGLLTVEEQCIFYKKKFYEVQADFAEYQRSSSELEHELDSHIAQKEKKIHDLEAKNAFFINENEALKNKLEKITSQSRQQIETLTKKLEDVSELNEQLTTHIRELEQSNDDLERAKRHLDATLADFDSKLNEQIERNELLESEIGEKEEMQSVIQRLKDEARDLRQELMIQQSIKPKKMCMTHEDASTTSPKLTDTTTMPSKSKTLMNGNSEIKSVVNSATSPTANSACVNGVSKSSTLAAAGPIPLLSASSRISALNIVSELLRKVGALESKLASCRNIIPASGSVLIKSNSLSRDPSLATSLGSPTAATSNT